MRLLVEVGYTKVLFGKGAPVAEIIAAFEGCKIVKEESGWQQPKRYLVESDAEIGVTLINEDAISLPDVVDNGGHAWPGKPQPAFEAQFGHGTTEIDATTLLFQFFFEGRT